MTERSAAVSGRQPVVQPFDALDVVVGVGQSAHARLPVVKHDAFARPQDLDKVFIDRIGPVAADAERPQRRDDTRL